MVTEPWIPRCVISSKILEWTGLISSALTAVFRLLFWILVRRIDFSFFSKLALTTREMQAECKWFTTVRGWREDRAGVRASMNLVRRQRGNSQLVRSRAVPWYIIQFITHFCSASRSIGETMTLISFLVRMMIVVHSVETLDVTESLKELKMVRKNSSSVFWSNLVWLGWGKWAPVPVGVSQKCVCEGVLTPDSEEDVFGASTPFVSTIAKVVNPSTKGSKCGVYLDPA